MSESFESHNKKKDFFSVNFCTVSFCDFRDYPATSSSRVPTRFEVSTNACRSICLQLKEITFNLRV